MVRIRGYKMVRLKIKVRKIHTVWVRVSFRKLVLSSSASSNQNSL